MTGWSFSNRYNDFYCWGVAIISFIYKNTLELKCEDDFYEPDKSVNRFSFKIAQLGTYSGQYEWKNELRIGDQVDVFHNERNWQPSTILSFKEIINLNGRA